MASDLDAAIRALCGTETAWGRCTLPAGHRLADEHCAGCDSNGHYDFCLTAAGVTEEDDHSGTG